MGRRHSVRAASVKAAVIRFTKLVFLKQVRVKRDQPHWLTDEEGTRIGRPNSEGARASRPDRKESSTSLQKGLALARKESVAVVPGRSSRGERLKGKEALPPRCREANGGVAVVAAGAAMNRKGGIMPKSHTRKLNDTQL